MKIVGNLIYLIYGLLLYKYNVAYRFLIRILHRS